MSDPKIKRYLEAELENIAKILEKLNPLIKVQDEEISLTQLAAISTFLHNIYNGLENILKRIALFRGVTLSRSSTWHKDLLLSSHKQGIFSEKSLNDLMNLLSFRHFFVHSYVFNVTWIDLKPLAQSIDKVVHRFKKEIFRFLAL